MFIHLSFTNGACPYLYRGSPGECKQELERWGRSYYIICTQENEYKLIKKYWR